MLIRPFLLSSFTALLLFSSLAPGLSKEAQSEADDDEDLSFLEEPSDLTGAPSHFPGDHYPDSDQYDEEDYEDFSDVDEPVVDQEAYRWPEVDDRDIVVLKERNFSDFVEENRFVMVEFYAPWCGHCQALAPEYAAAATELKGEEVAFAKVDATEEEELARDYEVQGFPTVYFFVDGVHKPYTGQRTKDAIVTWIRKKIGPGVFNITTFEDAERILASESKVALSYLNHLQGPESEELAAASKIIDDVNFYQTANPDIAKLFHLDPKVKCPALVLLKREAENLSHFGGHFVKSEIVEFVSTNKLPLVTIFTRESASSIFESLIKKQLLLFAVSKDSEKFLQTFQEAAKMFKGKLIFVYVEMDNEDFGKPISDYFGVTGDAPKVIAYTGNDERKKFILDSEITLDKIKAFAENFLEDKLKPFYKSDPIPETNNGDVKIVVANNFDEIVLDESKDVLLKIYAPWCGHCQALEPIYSKLAEHLQGIDSLVLAKMDGTTNEHPRAKAEGFPTLLFFPAGKKSFDPITVDTNRTVVAFYKFLKKHASVPFKLQKPTLAPKPESAEAKASEENLSTGMEDEL